MLATTNLLYLHLYLVLDLPLGSFFRSPKREVERGDEEDVVGPEDLIVNGLLVDAIFLKERLQLYLSTPNSIQEELGAFLNSRISDFDVLGVFGYQFP